MDINAKLKQRINIFEEIDKLANKNFPIKNNVIINSYNQNTGRTSPFLKEIASNKRQFSNKKKNAKEKKQDKSTISNYDQNIIANNYSQTSNLQSPFKDSVYSLLEYENEDASLFSPKNEVFSTNEFSNNGNNYSNKSLNTINKINFSSSNYVNNINKNNFRKNEIFKATKISKEKLNLNNSYYPKKKKMKGVYCKENPRNYSPDTYSENESKRSNSNSNQANKLNKNKELKKLLNNSNSNSNKKTTKIKNNRVNDYNENNDNATGKTDFFLYENPIAGNFNVQLNQSPLQNMNILNDRMQPYNNNIDFVEKLNYDNNNYSNNYPYNHPGNNNCLLTNTKSLSDPDIQRGLSGEVSKENLIEFPKYNNNVIYKNLYNLENQFLFADFKKENIDSFFALKRKYSKNSNQSKEKKSNSPSFNSKKLTNKTFYKSKSAKNLILQGQSNEMEKSVPQKSNKKINHFDKLYKDSFEIENKIFQKKFIIEKDFLQKAKPQITNKAKNIIRDPNLFHCRLYPYHKIDDRITHVSGFSYKRNSAYESFDKHNNYEKCSNRTFNGNFESSKNKNNIDNKKIYAAYQFKSSKSEIQNIGIKKINKNYGDNYPIQSDVLNNTFTGVYSNIVENIKKLEGIDDVSSYKIYRTSKGKRKSFYENYQKDIEKETNPKNKYENNIYLNNDNSNHCLNNNNNNNPFTFTPELNKKSLLMARNFEDSKTRLLKKTSQKNSHSPFANQNVEINQINDNAINYENNNNTNPNNLFIYNQQENFNNLEFNNNNNNDNNNNFDNYNNDNHEKDQNEFNNIQNRNYSNSFTNNFNSESNNLYSTSLQNPISPISHSYTTSNIKQINLNKNNNQNNNLNQKQKNKYNYLIVNNVKIPERPWLLYNRGMEALKRKQAKSFEKQLIDNELYKNYSFKPQINKRHLPQIYRGKTLKIINSNSKRDLSDSPKDAVNKQYNSESKAILNFNIYEKQLIWKNNVERRTKKIKDEKKNVENKECVFRPEIIKNEMPNDEKFIEKNLSQIQDYVNKRRAFIQKTKEEEKYKEKRFNSNINQRKFVKKPTIPQEFNLTKVKKNKDFRNNNNESKSKSKEKSNEKTNINLAIFENNNFNNKSPIKIINNINNSNDSILKYRKKFKTDEFFVENKNLEKSSDQNIISTEPQNIKFNYAFDNDLNLPAVANALNNNLDNNENHNLDNNNNFNHNKAMENNLNFNNFRNISIEDENEFLYGHTNPESIFLYQNAPNEMSPYNPKRYNSPDININMTNENAFKNNFILSEKNITFSPSNNNNYGNNTNPIFFDQNNNSTNNNYDNLSYNNKNNYSNNYDNYNNSKCYYSNNQLDENNLLYLAASGNNNLLNNNINNNHNQNNSASFYNLQLNRSKNSDVLITNDLTIRKTNQQINKENNTITKDKPVLNKPNIKIFNLMHLEGTALNKNKSNHFPNSSRNVKKSNVISRTNKENSFYSSKIVNNTTENFNTFAHSQKNIGNNYSYNLNFDENANNHFAKNDPNLGYPIDQQKFIDAVKNIHDRLVNTNI